MFSWQLVGPPGSPRLLIAEFLADLSSAPLSILGQEIRLSAFLIIFIPTLLISHVGSTAVMPIF